MPPLSIMERKCFFVSGIKSRRIILDLLRNRRLFLCPIKYSTNLGPLAGLTSFGKNDISCHLNNRKKEEAINSTVLHSRLAISRYDDLSTIKVLKRCFNTDSILHQVRKGDDQHDIVESSHPKAGQLTVGQKGWFASTNTLLPLSPWILFDQFLLAGSCFNQRKELI